MVLRALAALFPFFFGEKKRYPVQFSQCMYVLLGLGDTYRS